VQTPTSIAEKTTIGSSVYCGIPAFSASIFLVLVIRPGGQLNTKMGRFVRIFAPVFLGVSLLIPAAIGQAIPIKVTTIAVFDGNDGAGPSLETLAQGEDGNLYGTAVTGSRAKQGGSVFQITPAGSLTVLHVFDGYDGWHPAAGLVLGSDGLFYGNTRSRGNYQPDDGTIFSIASDGTFNLLDMLDDRFANPSASLVQGADGNYYGTSPGKGGSITPGSVFEVTSAGQIKLLHAFSRLSDGANPVSGLIQGTDGAFYGTTSDGAFGCGTIFRMSPAGYVITLHAFRWVDGCIPLGTLVQANDGNFYGTTYSGGSGKFGTVFQMTPCGDLTTLHNFDVFDGASPYAGLVQATDGKLYGTTDSGSFGNYGLIFSITMHGDFSVLQRFDRFHGDGPEGGLVQHTNGLLYGTTTFGGLTNHGTIYTVDIGAGPFIKTVETSGTAGQQIGILGSGFSKAIDVAFEGTTAVFNIVSDTYITATVPSGATSGVVQVRIPSGTLSSNVNFQVLP
jgi:uncharacterized repeat protein (TIGR03803 family)